MTLCFITMIEQGVSFQWIQLLVCASPRYFTDVDHFWPEGQFALLIWLAFWLLYLCQILSGLSTMGVCTTADVVACECVRRRGKGFFYFFVHPVKPIIINNWLRHTGVFAECICTIHRKHCRVHYIYLQQKFKGDPMWVFSSVFYCLWLSLGSL